MSDALQAPLPADPETIEVEAFVAAMKAMHGYDFTGW